MGSLNGWEKEKSKEREGKGREGRRVGQCEKKLNAKEKERKGRKRKEGKVRKGKEKSRVSYSGMGGE